jgi:phage N-6-adenine-methyltransferase
MKFRPEADVFPLMNEEQLKSLAEDINEHGQLLPISIYEGEILDGRNRWLAITQYGANGTQPDMVEVSPESPISFVRSANKERRHLTPGQDAMAAARALPFYEAEAKRRQVEGGEQYGKGHPKVTADRRQPNAAAEAAAEWGSSPRMVEKAKRIQKKGSKRLIEVVDRADLSVDKAHEIIRRYPDKRTQDQVVGEITKSKMTSRVKGLTGEVEWYTPRDYLDAAVEVMGAIDLDPASSEAAQANVKARQYYTREDDGLQQRWHGRVFLNPPYAMPIIRDFVTKMVEEYQAGNFDQGILLTNNATDTAWWHLTAGNCSALCFTRGRISFLQARDGELLTKEAPTHGQVFFYFGPNVEQFKDVFNNYGMVLRPDL